MTPGQAVRRSRCRARARRTRTVRCAAKPASTADPEGEEPHGDDARPELAAVIAALIDTARLGTVDALAWQLALAAKAGAA